MSRRTRPRSWLPPYFRALGPTTRELPPRTASSRFAGLSRARKQRGYAAHPRRSELNALDCRSGTGFKIESYSGTCRRPGSEETTASVSKPDCST